MSQSALDFDLARQPSFENYELETLATQQAGAADGAAVPETHAAQGPSAVAHLKLWVQGPRRSSLPVYLWGESGSGKTHLLLAAQSALEAQGLQTFYLSAQDAHPPPFDPVWNAVLLDDTDRYTAQQQHAAFSYMVQAQAAQAGVVAAGLWAPAALPLRDDLRSRLGWGDVFTLALLSDAKRLEVLKVEAHHRGLALSDEVLAYIHKRFSRDLGSLLDLLDDLDRYAMAQKRAVTIALLKQMLGEM